MAYYDPNDVVPNILSEEIAQELTADEPGDPIDMDVITEACNDASDEIDSYCGKKFVVPFDPVPDEIKRACKTIIGYNLFNRRVASGQVNKYENAYDRIVKWLILISQGKATIDGAVKATANPTQTGGQVSGTHRTFTDKSMKGF